MIYRWGYIGPQPLFIFIFPSPSGRTYWSNSKYAIKEKDCSSKNGATWEQLHTRFLFYLLSTFQAELLDQKPLITVTTHYPTHVSPSTGLFLFLYPLHFLFDLTALGHFPPAKMYCFCSSFYTVTISILILHSMIINAFKARFISFPCRFDVDIEVFLFEGLLRTHFP